MSFPVCLKVFKTNGFIEEINLFICSFENNKTLKDNVLYPGQCSTHKPIYSIKREIYESSHYSLFMLITFYKS